MKTLLALLSITLLIPLAAAAQEEIDPAAVSPDLYKVLLENEHVRILEYRVEPGAVEPWHTHPAKAMYVVEGGTLQITLEDGTTFLSEEKVGEAHWMGPVGKHMGKNVGSTPVRIVVVEVKAANDAPAENADSLREMVDPGR